MITSQKIKNMNVYVSVYLCIKFNQIPAGFGKKTKQIYQIMSINDLITKEGKTIVVIELQDLREWHNEVVEITRRTIEDSLNKQVDKISFVSPTEACQILRISRTTLARWAKIGYLVPFEVGGKRGYKKSDIDGILKH